MRYGSLPSSAHYFPGLLGVALTVLTTSAAIAATPDLPGYNADISQTSISGISSGAFMAVQFGTAWSSIVKGVGAIAGGPFGCSEGSGSAALSTCMIGLPAIDLQDLIARTDAFGADGGIDNTSLLANEKIYLFHGYNDQVVAQPVGDALFAFYSHYQPKAGNIFYQTAVGAGHSQVTVAYGGRCSKNGGEYINHCGYDQAGVILQHIYGALNQPAGSALTGQLLSFKQGPFTAPDQPIDASMDDTGFVYIPSACAAREPCRVHIALHGCKQSVSNIGQDFVQHAGYNEWADANHMIVLYPQTQALGMRNPEACWDWWGYLDQDPTVTPTYLLKSGKQIKAIKAMLDRLTSQSAAPTDPEAAPLIVPAFALSPDRSDVAVDIVWSPVTGIASYDVFRAVAGSDNFEKIATVAGLSYGDAQLKPATAYRYKIRASSDNGAGFSPVVTQTTLPKVPKCIDPGTCSVN